MWVRRGLVLGGAAVVAMLATMSAAASAGAAGRVVSRHAARLLGVAPVDHAVQHLSAPGSVTPTLAIPKVERLP